MGREEDLLRAACAEAAREEAERLENSLTPNEIRQADRLYRRHRRKALDLIRRKTAARPFLSRVLLPAAAALLVILAGTLLALNRAPKEPLTLQQAPSVSVVPYYSPSPTPTAVPATQAPAASPSPTVSPTQTPKPTEIPSPSPTLTPSPTLAPSPTPIAPENWTGLYFPMDIPGMGVVSVAREENRQSAVFIAQGDPWTFTEYDGAELIPVPEGAALSYVQWDGAVALRAADEEGVTLSWTLNGRSFSLRGPQGREVEIAQKIKKISEE